MKTHLAVSESRPNGGEWTGTLCGLSSRQSEDGTNAEPDAAKVTCKKCLKIMAWPAHWAHRRFISRNGFLPSPE